MKQYGRKLKGPCQCEMCGLDPKGRSAKKMARQKAQKEIKKALVE